MRVLIVANHWSTTGGIEQMVVDTASAFLNMGAVVHIWGIHDDIGTSIHGLRSVPFAPISHLSRGIYFRLTWKRKLESSLMEPDCSYDLVIVAHLYLLDPVLRSCRHRQEQKPVVWLWVYGIEAWGNTAKKHMHRLSEVDRILSISRFTAEQISGMVDSDRLAIVPPSVDTRSFIPAEDYEVVSRNTILIVGRLSKNERYKGHDSLIRILPRIEQKTGFRVRLVIVGEGNDKPRLEDYTARLGLDDRVVFRGRVSRSELILEYQRCALFAMPSKIISRQRRLWAGEGFGIVYLEAQACGRPVIASSEGGAPESIIENVSGLLVNPSDDMDIVAAVSKLLRDKELSDSLGRSGRRFMEQKFCKRTFESHMNRLVQESFRG